MLRTKFGADALMDASAATARAGFSARRRLPISGSKPRGTQTTGEPIEVLGCDLFEFTDGKISRKDSYWKIVD